MFNLAIDPGVDTGWALFEERDGALVRCGVGDPPWTAHLLGAVIEKPQVYRAAKSKGDPNDLITLAIRVGRYVEKLAMRGIACNLVTPVEWKGQVPKEIHHRRVLGVLSLNETEIVQSAYKGMPVSIRHNMLDAIGLGQWAHKAGKW